MVEHKDHRVLAAATALAKEATAEFIRVNGSGRPWDWLTYDRQQAAIQSQIKYAQVALDAATSAAPVAYSDGGPVPATPEEFADQVQVIVLDSQVTTGEQMDIQLGQLAIAYARHVLPDLRLQEGPWPTTQNPLRSAVERLRDEQYEIVTTPGMPHLQVQAAATKSFAFQAVLDLIDKDGDG